MDNLKVADVIKRFCIWILDTIFLHEELPVLEIPKLSSGMANLSIDNVTTKRKLHCAESARQYAEILAVAAVIVETVLSNKFMSQRDVYYSLKHQFSTQAVCNTRIIELGLLWRLKRYEMHITPTSKGYIAGQVSFRFNTAPDADGLGGQWTNCARFARQGGVSISSLWASSAAADMQVELLQGVLPVRHLLVIEKEGIFKRLCEDGFHLRMGCVMVTGCGYPDISTRACVSRLATLFPNLLVLGVCDYNPHGLGLLHTYKGGSVAMAFEGADFLTRSLRWVGLRQKHIASLSVAGGGNNNSNCQWPGDRGSGAENCLPRASFEKYSLSDHRKVASLLKLFANPPGAAPTTDHPAEAVARQYRQYTEELLKMQSGGTKCELESLYTFGLEFIGAFLERCILAEDYI